MSHVTTVDLHITDLAALAAAAKILGMELSKAETYKWFGSHVGDFPLPDGFTAQDIGQCEYKLTIKDNDKAYEVGVVKRRDGKPGYTLLWDFWQGGYGLQDVVGKDAQNLKQEYGIASAMREMARKGFRTERRLNQQTNRPQMRAWR